MRALNKFIRAVATIPVHLLVLLYSWILSFIVTSFIAVIVCSVMSILAVLPEIVLTKFWLLYLFATIPLTIVFFIVIEADRSKDWKDNSVEYLNKKFRIK